MSCWENKQIKVIKRPSLLCCLHKTMALCMYEWGDWGWLKGFRVLGCGHWLWWAWFNGSMAAHIPKLISISFAAITTTRSKNMFNWRKPLLPGWLLLLFAAAAAARRENLIFKLQKTHFSNREFPRAVVVVGRHPLLVACCSNCMTNSCQLSHTFCCAELKPELAFG